MSGVFDILSNVAEFSLATNGTNAYAVGAKPFTLLFSYGQNWVFLAK